ncbi:hypothetical protein BDZ89DRAFT_188871 [Hymenopellis radicata]|nr:hypothetical protein BDZ89DRAFT_188871 [Hymenopellis radicata]
MWDLPSGSRETRLLIYFRRWETRFPTSPTMRPSASSSSTLELDHLDYSSSSRVESGKLLEDEEKEWNTSDFYDDWQEKDETRSAQDEPSPRRPSLRLMVVHFLHGMLLLISIFTLLISFWRWSIKSRLTPTMSAKSPV